MKKIILVLTLLMAVNISAQAAYFETVIQEVEVVNGDFEQPPIYDASEDPLAEYGDAMCDELEGWENHATSHDYITPGINKYTVEPDPENSDNHCLLIWDTRQEPNGQSTTDVWSSLIPVDAGSKIQVSLRAYLKYESIGVNEAGTTINSRALYMKVCYFNASGIQIGSEPQITHSNADENKNKWKDVVIPQYTVPAGASYIRFIAMCTSSHTAKVYIDDFSIKAMKEKSISDPVFSAEQLNPNESIDISIGIKNNTGMDFPVYAAAGLFNAAGEITDIQTADNSFMRQGDFDLVMQMMMPADVEGYKIRVLTFTTENNRLKAYDRWFEK